jgi:hypothetical protein
MSDNKQKRKDMNSDDDEQTLKAMGNCIQMRARSAPSLAEIQGKPRRYDQFPSVKIKPQRYCAWLLRRVLTPMWV